MKKSDFESTSKVFLTSKQKKSILRAIGFMFIAMSIFDFVNNNNHVSTLRWSWIIDPIAHALGNHGLSILELTIGIAFVLYGLLSVNQD